MAKLSHIDEHNRPTMVDVSDKQPTIRTAHARTMVEFPAEVASRFAGGDIKTLEGGPFTYGKVEKNFLNPGFVAFGRRGPPT